MIFCNHTLLSCFELHPEIYFHYLAFAVTRFGTTFNYFTIMFLNGFIIYLILLTKAIPGNYKYIMLINNVNNMAYITQFVFLLFLGVYTPFQHLPAGFMFLQMYLRNGLFLYKLPLTLNKLIAVAAPFNFELLTTKLRTCLLSGFFTVLNVWRCFFLL